MEFYKYHSLGNDYLIYDCNKNQEALDKEKIVKLFSFTDNWSRWNCRRPL